MIKVDIILVSYCQERFIEQALASISKQVVNKDVFLRLIVADDYSTDNTLSIIHRLVSGFSFPVVILPTSHNLGIAKNYQRAFSECDGDYIAILEGDDYWSSPSHIQEHIDFLTRYPECSMSMNRITYCDENGKLYSFRWGYSESHHFVSTREQIENGNQLGNLSACVLRTRFVKHLPDTLYDLPIADWMLGVMLSQYGPIGLFEETTSVYRKNANSTWASKSHLSHVRTMIQLANKYDSFQQGLFHKNWRTFKHNLIKQEWIRLMKGMQSFLKTSA